MSVINDTATEPSEAGAAPARSEISITKQGQTRGVRSFVASVRKTKEGNISIFAGNSTWSRPELSLTRKEARRLASALLEVCRS